jgi:histidyl-tRNA synthetase
VAENELPLTSDAEIVSIINRVFTELDLGSFTVRLNNRKLLSGFLASLDLADQITTVLRLIDKLDKIGRDGVREELLAAGIDGQKTDQILDFVSLSGDVLAQLAALSVDDETFRTGLAELTAVVSYLEDFGVPAKNYQIDLSIARGLDYYTGTVYETVLNDYPQIGSVCSGGRYNDLAGYYTNRCFPGVGVSIGLTRLFYQLEAAGLVKTERRTTADILLLSEDLAAANRLAEELRNSGLAVIGAYGPEKFKKKLAFANKLGVAGVVILGGDELAGGYYSVKNMISGEQVKATDVVAIKKFLNLD